MEAVKKPFLAMSVEAAAIIKPEFDKIDLKDLQQFELGDVFILF